MKHSPEAACRHCGGMHPSLACHLDEGRRKYDPCPGGVRQTVVTTTGDFAQLLQEAVRKRYGV